MKTYGTYFQNDKDLPIKYGEINLINPVRQRLRLYKGVEVYPVFQGFCGTDFELMKMVSGVYDMADALNAFKALANNDGTLAKLLIKIGD